MLRHSRAGGNPVNNKPFTLGHKPYLKTASRRDAKAQRKKCFVIPAQAGIQSTIGIGS
jgi:hypothetical protein